MPAPCFRNDRGRRNSSDCLGPLGTQFDSKELPVKFECRERGINSDRLIGWLWLPDIGECRVQMRLHPYHNQTLRPAGGGSTSGYVTVSVTPCCRVSVTESGGPTVASPHCPRLQLTIKPSTVRSNCKSESMGTLIMTTRWLLGFTVNVNGSGGAVAAKIMNSEELSSDFPQVASYRSVAIHGYMCITGRVLVISLTSWPDDSGTYST